MSCGVERVYVGTTLAPGGDRVVDAGAAVAGALGARLHLVHVLSPGADTACREERDRRLRDRADRLGPARGARCELRISADVARALLSFESAPGTMLVVGAHESDGVLGKRLGDTCAAVLQLASSPVLVARGSWQLASTYALAHPRSDSGSSSQSLASELEAQCRALQPDLVVLLLPSPRGPLGRWRRWRAGRLVGRLEPSVLLLPV